MSMSAVWAASRVHDIRRASTPQDHTLVLVIKVTDCLQMEPVPVSVRYPLPTCKKKRISLYINHIQYHVKTTNDSCFMVTSMDISLLSWGGWVLHMSELAVSVYSENKSRIIQAKRTVTDFEMQLTLTWRPTCCDSRRRWIVTLRMDLLCHVPFFHQCSTKVKIPLGYVACIVLLVFRPFLML